MVKDLVQGNPSSQVMGMDHENLLKDRTTAGIAPGPCTYTTSAQETFSTLLWKTGFEFTSIYH